MKLAIKGYVPLTEESPEEPTLEAATERHSVDSDSHEEPTRADERTCDSATSDDEGVCGEEHGDAADETSSDDVPRDVTAKHRRRRAVGVGVALVLVVLTLYRLNANSTTSTTQAMSLPATPREQVSALIVAGQHYNTLHGTYSGFAPDAPTGVRVGAAGAGMVVSVKQAGQCFYGTVTPTGVSPVRTDPTGSACTDALIAKATQALATQTNAQSTDVQAQMLNTASAAALAFKSEVATGVVVSRLVGHDLVPNATVTSVDATSGEAVVTLTTSDACEVVHVYPNGSASALTPCRN